MVHWIFSAGAFLLCLEVKWLNLGKYWIEAIAHCCTLVNVALRWMTLSGFKTLIHKLGVKL